MDLKLDEKNMIDDNFKTISHIRQDDTTSTKPTLLSTLDSKRAQAVGIAL